MHLPLEYDPGDRPLYLVVTIARSTGAREATTLTHDRQQALDLARATHARVIEINVTADYRNPR